MHDFPTPELPIISNLSNCESLPIMWCTFRVCYTAFTIGIYIVIKQSDLYYELL